MEHPRSEGLLEFGHGVRAEVKIEAQCCSALRGEPSQMLRIAGSPEAITGMERPLREAAVSSQSKPKPVRPSMEVSRISRPALFRFRAQARAF